MKNSIVGILLVLCLLMSACGNTLPDAAETQPTEATEAPVSGQETQDTQPQEVEKYPEAHEVVPVGEDYIQYGNMQKGSVGRFILYGNEIIFNTVGKSGYFSYDIETGKVRRFCIKENCDHEGSDCVGINTLGAVVQYNGKLYQEKHNSNSLNSIQVLENGKWEDIVTDVYDFWIYDGDLYTQTRVGRKLQVYADGTGEPKTLAEDCTAHWTPIFDGYLYGEIFLNAYVTDNQLIRVDLTAETYAEEVAMEDAYYYMIDGEHIYYVGGLSATEEPSAVNFPYFLYRCDMDGSNKEVLYNSFMFPASLNFDDEYIYYRKGTEINGPLNTRDIYRMSKEDPTQIEKIATLPESVYQIFTVPGQDLLFATGASFYEGNNHMENIYVMNADGSNLRQLELP